MSYEIAAPTDGLLQDIVTNLLVSEKKTLEFLDRVFLQKVETALKKERERAKLIADEEAKNRQIVAAPSISPETLIAGMTSAFKEVNQNHMNNIQHVYSPLIQNSHQQTMEAVKTNFETLDIYNNSLQERIRSQNTEIQRLHAEIEKITHLLAVMTDFIKKSRK